MQLSQDIVLETQRLRLTALRRDGFETVRQALLAEKERVASAFARTLTALEDDPAGYLLDSNREWTQGSRYRFCLWQDGRFQGLVILREVDWQNRSAELAYLLLARAEGQGLAFEACSLVVKWARSLGLDDLWLRIVPGNQRSERLAERLGFTPDTRQGEDYVDAAERVHKTKRYALRRVRPGWETP